MDNLEAQAYRARLNRFFISQLMLGQAVWQVPQMPGRSILPAPVNPFTNRLYRGANALRLLAAQQEDPRWLTQQEIELHGLQLQTGTFGRQILIKENGQWIAGRVYNGSEIIGLPAFHRDLVSDIRPLEYAKDLIAHYGVRHVENSAAGFHYSSEYDTLHSPAGNEAGDPRAHYSTIFYHLMRADGHATRNARDVGQVVTSTGEIDPKSAEEALRVHIAALLVSSRLNIPFVPDPQENYATYWPLLVERDADLLVRVAGEADVIASRFIEKAREVTLTQERINKPQSAQITLPRGKRILPDDRFYLFVPYEEREMAFSAGSFWDEKKRMHYIHVQSDRAPFARWTQPPKALTPQGVIDSFRRECESFGLNMSGSDAYIAMDGKWRGVPVTTSENTKKSAGRYKLEADGRGVILNLDTGISGPWRPDAPMADDPKTQSQLEEARKNQARIQAAEKRKQEAAEAECGKRWAALPSTNQHPYTDRKQVPAIGLKKWGDDLAIPMQDEHGTVRNIQRISPEASGRKLYQASARKNGLFHVLGELEGANTVFFNEGYATGGSIHLATKMPVVVCFDSGNIEAAMRAVRDRIPGADKIICADNDLVTPERAANSLNGAVREKLGYPRIKPEDITAALANGGKVKLDGREGFELRVREVAEASHYDMPRLYPEIWRDGQRLHKIVVNNAGMEKALAAAAAEGAKVVAPNFRDVQAHGKGHKDYNDLHVNEGLESVRWQLASVVDLVKGRQFAEERARELKFNLIEVRPAENDARHVGQIVLHAGCHAVQETGRNTAVAHAYKDLDRIPAEGQMTRIEYKGGRGTVADINSPERSQGRGR